MLHLSNRVVSMYDVYWVAGTPFRGMYGHLVWHRNNVTEYSIIGSVAGSIQIRDELVSTYLHPKQLKAEIAQVQICI